DTERDEVRPAERALQLAARFSVLGDVEGLAAVPEGHPSFLVVLSGKYSDPARQLLQTLLIDGAATMRPTKSKSSFTAFAKWTARATGRPLTFALALAIIVAWGVSGPLFGFSDTWQLVINTGTTIITFLMVFLIQNTQN